MARSLFSSVLALTLLATSATLVGCSSSDDDSSSGSPGSSTKADLPGVGEKKSVPVTAASGGTVEATDRKSTRLNSSHRT